jgi:hypothetical protein
VHSITSSALRLIETVAPLTTAVEPWLVAEAEQSTVVV